MPKKTRDVIVASSDWTVPSEDGLHRRTIVKGAAWTVPVAAVSIATPAAAASKTPTLAFTKDSYSGTACGTITGVQVKRTTDGTTADPGKTVTVTLKDGYTFKDGTTTYSGTTDASGLITLPDIKVPGKGGDTNFSATSDTLSASAPVTTATKDGVAKAANVTTTAGTYEIAKVSTSVGAKYYLTSDNKLYYKDTLVASDVTSAVGNAEGSDTVTFVSGGVAKVASGTTVSTPYTIADVKTSVGCNYFLTSDNKLYYKGDLVATDVTSAVGNAKGGDSVYFVTGGVAKNATGTKIGDTFTTKNVTTAVGANYYITSDNKLYHANDLVDSNVTSAVGIYTGSNDSVSYVSNGTAKSATVTTISNTYTFKDATTAVGANYFLTSGNDLYHGNDLVATDVTSAVGIYTTADTVTYVTTACA
ncbi:hypothetical protein [Rathayibacter rathayi]|uniref:hypothetical protein n=1 Tax=Rathayibacter rathayi TaxID=33887 RepID=UPI000CE84109|nr:hypothetical protein [Rathayibacter rathayi]PPF46363.1 hypothetical protein C5C08_11765 [Rathayibacter rathayi]